MSGGGGNAFIKRQKERARKEKQDEKSAKKAARRAGLLPSSDGDAIVETPEGATPDAPSEPPPSDRSSPTQP